MEDFIVSVKKFIRATAFMRRRGVKTPALVISEEVYNEKVKGREQEIFKATRIINEIWINPNMEKGVLQSLAFEENLKLNRHKWRLAASS